MNDKPLVLRCKREIELWDAAIIAALSLRVDGDVSLVADAVIEASRLRKIQFLPDDSPY